MVADNTSLKIPRNPHANIDKMLEGRQDRYGGFDGHAKIAQGLKAVMHETQNWAKLTEVQKEGLEMIQHKIARMLNGDPTYLDNIVDVVGYATLIKNAMEQYADSPRVAGE